DSLLGGTGTLNIDAVNDDVVIDGNTANGEASGVAFEGSNDAILNLTVAAGQAMYMLDPVTTNMVGGADFTMDITQNGDFEWGGKNIFTSDTGAIAIRLLGSGDVYLAEDFSASLTTAGNGDLDFGSGTIYFDIARSSEIAMFDVSGVSGTLTVAGSATLDIDLDSRNFLLDFEKDYFVIDGYDATVANELIDGVNTEIIEKNGDTWVTVKAAADARYADHIAGAYQNAIDGLEAIADLMTYVDGDTAELLGTNLDAAVPGFYMNMAQVGINSTISAAMSAKQYGLPGWSSDSIGYASVGSSDAYAAGNFPAAHCGVRFWAGYLGDFDRMDSHSRYIGFKSDRHGFVAGVNYDFSTAATIGIYGGYSRTTTKARRISSEVTSDGGHFGILGGFTPIREMPNLVITADAGYTFTDNDGWRRIGGYKTKGSFDQDIFTVGAEVAYKAQFNCLSLTPYVSARYTYADQDGFRETGLAAADLSGFHYNSFNTKVGAVVGYDFQSGNGTVFTPSVNVAWKHEYGDRQASSNAFFQGVANPTVFRQKSVKADRDSADIGVNLRTAFRTGGNKMVGFNVGYNLNVGSHEKNHSIYAGFDLGF
ncbi:MAG: autotransporter domain-containing protein, partial [Planctomycetes bacterium]|nr:autotransporter domain-containing protein [Planctomycetota bacterium]